MSTEKNETSVTELGNPAKPHGKAGEEMLRRMGESHSGVTEWALNTLELNGSERVLDIGCGGGDALKKMSARITSGRLTGVDYSEVSVELSRQRNIQDVNAGKIDIIKASAEALPFHDNSFDIIYTVESFYFWGRNADTLREVRRVLAGNGVFMIVADIHGDAELSDDAINNIRKYDLFNPSPAELRSLLTEAGFADTEILLKNGTSWICAKGYRSVE